MPVKNEPPASARAPRLEFLDGLRGVAAAMVVLHHLLAFTPVPALFSAVVAPNPWVAIFITLSGFCLYLPAAARPRVEMPRPFWEFMRRRARRILPAWYASLALCLLTGWFLARVHSPNAPTYLPRGVWDIPAHLLLVHSMTRFSGSINGPGYTLGTEWQLYLWMIVLVALAARLGWAALLAAAVFLSLPLPGFLLDIFHHLFSPIFGVPFIVGMGAARLVRLPKLPSRWRSWEVGVAAVVLTLAVLAFRPLEVGTGVVFSAWAAALATGAACLLMARRPAGVPARLLSSRVGQTLGGFSYSLYLTHFPLLGLAASVAAGDAVAPDAALVRVFLPALPLIFGFAYLFSLVFERPFLNTKPLPRPTPRRPLKPQDAAERAAAETW